MEFLDKPKCASGKNNATCGWIQQDTTGLLVILHNVNVMFCLIYGYCTSDSVKSLLNQTYMNGSSLGTTLWHQTQDNTLLDGFHLLTLRTHITLYMHTIQQDMKRPWLTQFWCFTKYKGICPELADRPVVKALVTNWLFKPFCHQDVSHVTPSTDGTENTTKERQWKK